MSIIRKMQKQDTGEVLSMMRVFYDSPAILHKADDAVLRQDITDCVSDEMPFIEGYVFEEEDKIVGYSMLAKSYSTEYGGVCIWIEDLYMKPKWRGKGIGSKFFEFIEEAYHGNCVRFRLEAEAGNARAIEVYKKCGYEILPYVELTKEV